MSLVEPSHPRRLRAAATLLLAALLVLTIGTPARAAGAGRILGIASEAGVLTVTFAAVGLDKGQSLDPASIALAANGRPLTAQAKPIATAVAPLQRSVVLVIDTSGSMQGPGLNGAKQAAEAYLAAVPADVAVGLISFSDSVAPPLAPTTDRAALVTAINALQAQGETALYDAVEAAITTLGKDGLRNILVLSDGADSASRTTLGTTTAALSAAKISLDAVAFRTNEAANGTLDQLASPTGGQVRTAVDAAGLTDAFTVVARAAVDQVTVTAALPQGLSGPATVQVSAVAGSTTLTDSAFTTLAATTAPAGPAKLEGPRAVAITLAWYTSTPAVTVALALLFLGLITLVAGVLGVGIGRSRGRVSRRLSLYTLTGKGPAVPPKPAGPTALGDSATARSAVGLATKVVQRGDFEERLGTRLDAAAVPLKPAEFLLIHVGTALGVALLALLVSGGSPLGALLGLGLGVAVPPLYLRLRRSRRQAAFRAQLPDTLQLLAGSLSAGYSLPQALDTVVREGNEPMAAEMRRAVVETRLGVDVNTAMDGIAERMESQDFEWVVMAIRIQREVGGNLSEVLGTVAHTMRERERIRRQVQSLSAEGRLSAVILGALPVVFALYLLAARRDYISVLYTDPIGFVLLGGLAVTLGIGIVWLRKVVKVEV